MSYVSPETIKAIAESVGVTKLKDDVAKTLVPDVDYYLRQVVEDALKFARHGKRQRLTTGDINNALRLRNVEPLYGFANKDPEKYMRAAGAPPTPFFTLFR